jgi:hypothetical protein
MSKEKSLIIDEQPKTSEEKFSIDGFLGLSDVVRKYNSYLVHGFKAWMREKDPTFLAQSHTLAEWEKFYTEYVNS